MNRFLRPRRVDDPALRFICFHHAGGAAAGYFPFARRLPADWDVLLHDLPGRGGRHAERPRREMDEVVESAVRDVAPLTDVPYVLFGHSMGAIVAAETARRLSASFAPPVWVGVSGREAPAAPDLGAARLAGLDDASLLATLLRLGGTPSRISEMPELRDAFLRVVRADLEAVGSYRPGPGRPALPCPVTAFGGLTDPWAPPAGLAGWRHETASYFRQHLFPGGHFYFADSAFAALARKAGTEIRAALTMRDRGMRFVMHHDEHTVRP